jgi:hypothetical protein
MKRKIDQVAAAASAPEGKNAVSKRPRLAYQVGEQPLSAEDQALQLALAESETPTPSRDDEFERAVQAAASVFAEATASGRLPSAAEAGISVSSSHRMLPRSNFVMEEASGIGGSDSGSGSGSGSFSGAAAMELAATPTPSGTAKQGGEHKGELKLQPLMYSHVQAGSMTPLSDAQASDLERVLPLDPLQDNKAWFTSREIRFAGAFRPSLLVFAPNGQVLLVRYSVVNPSNTAIENRPRLNKNGVQVHFSRGVWTNPGDPPSTPTSARLLVQMLPSGGSSVREYMALDEGKHELVFFQRNDNFNNRKRSKLRLALAVNGQWQPLSDQQVWMLPTDAINLVLFGVPLKPDVINNLDKLNMYFSGVSWPRQLPQQQPAAFYETYKSTFALGENGKQKPGAIASLVQQGGTPTEISALLRLEERRAIGVTRPGKSSDDIRLAVMQSLQTDALSRNMEKYFVNQQPAFTVGRWTTQDWSDTNVIDLFLFNRQCWLLGALDTQGRDAGCPARVDEKEPRLRPSSTMTKSLLQSALAERDTRAVYEPSHVRFERTMSSIHDIFGAGRSKVLDM